MNLREQPIKCPYLNYTFRQIHQHRMVMPERLEALLQIDDEQDSVWRVVCPLYEKDTCKCKADAPNGHELEKCGYKDS